MSILFFIFVSSLLFTCLLLHSNYIDNSIYTDLLPVVSRAFGLSFLNDQSTLNRLLILYESFYSLNTSLLGGSIIYQRIWHDGLVSQLLVHFGIFGIFLLFVLIFKFYGYILLKKIKYSTIFVLVFILSNFITEYYLVFKYSLLSFTIIKLSTGNSFIKH